MQSSDVVGRASTSALAIMVGATILLAPHLRGSELWSRFHRAPTALPVYGPPPPPPLVAAPALAPPITAERPKQKEIVAPKAIVVPERPPRQKRVDRVEHVKDAGLPPCSVIRREYKRMTYAQSISAYMAATPAQVAYGKRCLGM